MYRPSWIWSYSRIGQFLSLGPRPILYFNCICSWLVNNLEVSFWPTSISNIYEVYRCYIYIFTKPHPVELSFSGQLPSLTFAWRPSLILITWRLQPLLLCACCFSPPCLHLLLFCQLIISTLKVTHLKSGKRQWNFWTINCFLLKKRTKISSATFCLWNTTIRLGPHTLLFRISCWQGRATGRTHLPVDQVSDKLRS